MGLLDIILYCYENITPFQTAMLLSAMFLYVLYLFLRDMDVPPGPRGLPLFGYWPYLEADTCHLHLQKLSGKYGDVFSFRVAGKLLIHLGSIKAVKEAHLTKSENFAGRFDDSMLSFIFKDGVAFINGEPWSVLRKFFVSRFKEYGMNAVKENAARAVYDTLNEFVDELRSADGSPIEIREVITMKCMEIIRRVMFNEQGISMEELKELNDLFAETMQGMTSTNLLLAGKFAKYFILPLKPSMWTMKKCHARIISILSDVVNKHKSEYNESQVADLIDSFLKERDDRRRKGDPTAKYFSDAALASSISQFVTDGVLSVGVLVSNFLQTLVEYPDEQDKIFNEIVEVIGTDRQPILEDKINMPYTNAFIYEVTRFTDFFPLFPSLVCTRDTTIQEYKIPEGSITVINIYSCHRNPNDFENPNEFNPSRYLPSPGKQKAELPILFGVGKRSCIGEAFSMVQIFLFLTTIIQSFKLVIPESSQGTNFMYWSTEKLKICLIPRSHKSDSK